MHYQWGHPNRDINIVAVTLLCPSPICPSQSFHSFIPFFLSFISSSPCLRPCPPPSSPPFSPNKPFSLSPKDDAIFEDRFQTMREDEDFGRLQRLRSVQDDGMNSYYHGEIGRGDAEARLRGYRANQAGGGGVEVGDFLIRYSARSSTYCISFVVKGGGRLGILHNLVYQFPKNEQYPKGAYTITYVGAVVVVVAVCVHPHCNLSHCCLSLVVSPCCLSLLSLSRCLSLVVSLLLSLLVVSLSLSLSRCLSPVVSPCCLS